ncbi:MAG: septal ring lytic transglycosylase RlpA family protein, partial [Chthoniobacterales bacterium]
MSSTGITPATLFMQSGVASYYGERYQGRETASGEIFDLNKFTAAHRSLPFGDVV